MRLESDIMQFLAVAKLKKLYINTENVIVITFWPKAQ